MIYMETLISKARDLGLLLRRRRKQLGYTQAQTALLCGTGTRFISDVENGKETIELGKALRVAATLGIDIMGKTRGRDP